MKSNFCISWLFTVKNLELGLELGFVLGLELGLGLWLGLGMGWDGVS